MNNTTTKPINQNKMKQTAVQWLEECIKIGLTYEQEVSFEGLFQQALDMEKEQIENAFNYGQFDLGMEAEEYYNEIYKSE